jgi:catechol 2,3-dioxygenase-like lactoylglutathione lyase family enzyme
MKATTVTLPPVPFTGKLSALVATGTALAAIAITAPITLRAAESTELAVTSTPTILGIHHYALSVERVEETARWYVDTLGFRPERDFGFPEMGVRIIHLRHPSGVRLELLHAVQSQAGPDLGADAFGAIKNRGSKHLGLLVADISEAARLLKAQGVVVLHDVTRVEIAGVTNFWILDPEGNQIELVQPLQSQ